LIFENHFEKRLSNQPTFEVNEMHYAILADVHGNLEALQSALNYLRDRGIDRCYFPGDLVNYGANPNECLTMAEEISSGTIAGNHERALFDDWVAEGFNPCARQALEWTKLHLDPQWLPVLEKLPLIRVEKTFAFSHGSIAFPDRFEYLSRYEDSLPSWDALTTPIGWIGHTHVPQIFMKTAAKSFYLREGEYALDRDETYLINAGSVGQPRDGDSRLGFAVFDEESYALEMVRLPYNNQKAAKKIREAGLPAFLADRLF